MENRVAWIITNNAKGNRMQAEAVAQYYSKKRYFIIKLTKLQRLLTMSALSYKSSLLAEFPSTLPQVIIGCGRHSIPYLLAFKRKHRNKLKTIYIQDPRISSDHFDLILAKQMDRVVGANVFKTIGSLGALDLVNFKQSESELLKVAGKVSPPYLMISIGGGSRTCRYLFTKGRCKKLLTRLDAIIEKFKGSVFVTANGRTGVENIKLIKGYFADNKKVFFDSDCSTTLYHGMLSAANYILVSNDSVNIITEACQQNKPIYHYYLPGFIHSRKQKRFLNYLESKSHVKVFENDIYKYSQIPLNETVSVKGFLEKNNVL